MSFGGSTVVDKEKTKVLRREYIRGQGEDQSHSVGVEWAMEKTKILRREHDCGQEFAAAAEAPR